MAGYIPENIVQRIKSESDIVAVISEFVSLKKSGKDYKALCPFHQEKTPSFYVMPGKGFYYCFGCGKGGNVINFIMDHERLEYPDALRYLAGKASITIPVSRSETSDTEKLFEALSLAVSFYRKSLKETSAGKSALEYLKSREISDDAIELFCLGYAPDSWDALIKAASAKKIQPSVLERAGLVKKKEGYYDRFRNRLIIPIRTVSGKTVAFGARAMPGDDSVKYINSPETEVYKKRRTLFGLDISKYDIRDKNEAVVVEGYFDLISLYQSGIKNVVAVSGTGLANEQAALLARFCERVVLLYDSDSAGVRAAFRACGILYDSGIEPRLIRLPRGFDPDTFIREKSADSLSRLIAESTDVVDFVHDSLNGRFSAQPLSRQEKIIKALSETAGLIQDAVRRELLIKRIADKFDIAASSIERSIAKPSLPGRKQEGEPSSGRDKFERSFLGLLISHPELYPECIDVVDSSLFTEDGNVAIFDAIGKLCTSGREFTISDLFDEIGSNGLRNKLSEIVFAEETTAGSESIFNDYLRKFKKIAAKRRINELKRLIGEAERHTDQNKIEILTREFQKLKAEVEANDARG